MKTREDAMKLMESWVSSESLQKHCLSVATSMEAYAKKFLKEGKIKLSSKEQDSKVEDRKGCDDNIGVGEVRASSELEEASHEGEIDVDGVDNSGLVDKWWICGLLHDFDWERYPKLELHPKPGCDKLRKEGYDAEIVEAILGHNSYHGVKRGSLMAKTLFAVDELSGLIMALAKIRPGVFEEMSAKSVRKAMKKKDFAAAINRDEVRQGMEELGFTSVEEENGHFELVIGALSAKKVDLGV